MRQVLSSAKYIMLLPALSNVLAACVLIIYSAIHTLTTIVELLSKSLTGKIHKAMIFKTAISFIEIVDIMLLATVILISGLGLYELFIGNLKLPNWLLIRNLDDLKEKLIKAVVAVIAVQFLVAVVNNDPNLLSYGTAVSIVIIALTIFTNFSPSKLNKNYQTENYDSKLEKMVEDVKDRFIESLNQPKNITLVPRESPRNGKHKN
ncbi:YqhA family protein [Mastigocladopsis repens]|uniref:YqhA family protein n=1 Tax=Mastigocladopsis repens TaxID=221287 RepID=UPI0002FD9B97|nr:YqhA family protein [Mastigocladopsis repens]